MFLGKMNTVLETITIQCMGTSMPDTTLLREIEICGTNVPKLPRRQDLATARHDFFIAFH